MAAEWEGKSKGTVLGYKIYIFFLQNIGIGSAYFLLRFVVLYYFLFSFKSSWAIYQYLHKRLKYAKAKAWVNVYNSYYVFGKVLTDKVAISTGLRDKFTYSHDGIEYIDDLVDKKQGGILISGHVGNFEISHYFFEDRYSASVVSVVTTHAERQKIKDYMDRISAKSNLNFIVVQEDMSHIFQIHSALDEGGLVVFTGDRFLPGSKYLTETFMGKAAKFPLGPYLLASRLKIPVLFVYVMKGVKRHYNLYAHPANLNTKDAKGLLKEYTNSMEWILNKYPLQWFNYFDFWEDNLSK